MMRRPGEIGLRMDLPAEEWEALRLRDCEAALARSPGDRRAARLAAEIRAELADWRAHGSPSRQRDHASRRRPSPEPATSNGSGALLDALRGLDG